jgi:hypothetical protein
MDPKSLIDTSAAAPLPAPVWFIECFKALGFSLHEVPMNLWYAGIIVAMLLGVLGSQQGRRFASRLMTQMPVIIAMGINLGIVPLLFIQVGFAAVFYPATILMAWFWLSVVFLLVPAYYGVYIYAFALADGGAAMRAWKRAAGWAAAILFLAIGFIFANAMSLTENVAGWPALWLSHSIHGAALGTALNLADPRLWPRWLLMFGLALTTTGVWAAFDSAWFARGESGQYRLWAKQFAWRLQTIGVVWFAAAGSWYAFGAWPDATRQEMLHWPWVVLTIVTALAPGLPWLLLWRSRQREGEINRGAAALIALAQFGVLAVNAVSRQVVQHIEIRPYFDILTQPTETQWTALAVFLAAFVVGLGVVVWMIRQVVRLPAKP